MNLSQLNAEIPLADALEKCDPEWLEELGTDVDDVLEQFCEFMEALTSPEDDALQIRQITICGAGIKADSRRTQNFPCIRGCHQHRRAYRLRKKPAAGRHRMHGSGRHAYRTLHPDQRSVPGR